MQLTRPDKTEAASFYFTYIDKVPKGNVLETLSRSQSDHLARLETLSDDDWNYRYANGKWSVKELMIHIIDTERVMGYRALRIARNDMTPIPGFEQDDYVPYCGADERSPSSILEEYKAVRQSTLSLFSNFSEEMWLRKGHASGKEVSVKALAYIIAGHEIHHWNVLKDRYWK